MANLSFSDKQLINSVFGMSTGYVADFSNSEFQDFMSDVVQYDIYEKYPGLSKAKMFREFLKDESEAYVGKSIILLINYMNSKGLISNNEEENSERLYELGKKFLGKIEVGSTNKIKNRYAQQTLTIDYDSLNTSLLSLEKITIPQTRGYEFEKYLNKLFNSFGLDPRASYRTQFDQIDGSFILENNTILVEAKYKSKLIPKDELILFSNKIEQKSHFTRGIFITFSTVDKNAIDYFNDRSSRFIVLTVEELYK